METVRYAFYMYFTSICAVLLYSGWDGVTEFITLAWPLITWKNSKLILSMTANYAVQFLSDYRFVMENAYEYFGLSENPLLLYMIYIYFGAVGTATVYGAGYGFNNWISWILKRKYRPIAWKTVEPIVNASVDAGVMALMVASSAIASAAVAITAPISVPLLLAVASER